MELASPAETDKTHSDGLRRYGYVGFSGDWSGKIRHSESEKLSFKHIHLGMRGS